MTLVGNEPEVSTSGWTVDTLHQFHQQQLHDLRSMLEERYKTQTEAVSAAFEAQQLAMQTALTAADLAVTKALESAEKAVGKAEIAAEKRFDAVNEFRQQLGDQAATFMPRTEAEAGIKNNTDGLQQLSMVSHTHVPRAEMTSLFDRYDERLRAIVAEFPSYVRRVENEANMLRYAERIQELADRLNKAEGKGAGLGAAWGYAVAGLAVLGTLVSIYVATTGK